MVGYGGLGVRHGVGLVAVRCLVDLEGVCFRLFVLSTADSDKVVDVGGAVVAAPFFDVVEFASV